MGKVLFIDAEFVDNQEVIELSAWSQDGKELYHRFFRPEHIREWPISEGVHHISPEDVANCATFSSCRKEIQRLFDEAEYIVGFATSGDISHLAHSGISGLEKKQIIDIKHLFWLYVGIERDYDFYAIPGLSRVSDMLGVTFGEKGAHSASEDTLVTLKCFNELASMVPDVDYAVKSEENFKLVIERFRTDFDLAKDAYERKKAHGWIHIHKNQGGLYKVVFKRKEPEATQDLVGKIEVGDLSKAESEILSRFQHRMIQGNRTLFRFTKNDLKLLLAYHNEYGNEEEHNISKKLLKLQKIFLYLIVQARSSSALKQKS
ncbi:MAG: hypothetical protein K2H18_08595, partial [Muribaculaceae bacterium]|nr:hypothetical protein [Muribaculaceae bacterium]